MLNGISLPASMPTTKLMSCWVLSSYSCNGGNTCLYLPSRTIWLRLSQVSWTKLLLLRKSYANIMKQRDRHAWAWYDTGTRILPSAYTSKNKEPTDVRGQLGVMKSSLQNEQFVISRQEEWYLDGQKWNLQNKSPFVCQGRCNKYIYPRASGYSQTLLLKETGRSSFSTNHTVRIWVFRCSSLNLVHETNCSQWYRLCLCI